MEIVQADSRIIKVAGVSVELTTFGAGRPLLFLHPDIGINSKAEVLHRLAGSFTVFVPSHPGFGRSELPSGMTTVDDLSYFYLDFLEALELREVVLVGVSLGGWIASEIATKSTHRLSHLILSNALGVRVGARDARDITDIYALSQRELLTMSFHSSQGYEIAKASFDEDAYITLRNRESTALFGWSPYMNNPKLAGRLHRIRIPTLVLWGTSDKIAPLDYGRAYSSRIPGARLDEITQAGHYPHLEQPEAFARKVLAFVEGS